MPERIARITRGAAELNVDVDEAAARRMLEYLGILDEWSKAYNLSSVDGTDEQISYHLLDSLSVAPWLRGSRIADVGTGAGLPGIPLAIADPGRHYTLIESRDKKIRFLRHVCRELGLENVEIRHTRAEDYRPRNGFDTVVARALAALPKMATVTGHLLAPDGVLLAMKGRDPVAELKVLDDSWSLQGLHRVVVPGVDGQRHLALITKN